MTTQTAAAQQCFRSRPLLKEKGSVVSFFSCMARQKRTHGVSLHERAGVSPAVPPFLQRLLAVRIRLRIVLRHLQLIGIEFDHLAAGTFRLAFEMLHKLTHSPPACRPSEATLKRSVIVFLNFDRAADLQQIVHKLTVVALAGGRQAPMVLGKLCRRRRSHPGGGRCCRRRRRDPVSRRLDHRVVPARRAPDPAPRRTSRIRDRTGPVRPDAIERCKRCR